MGNSSSDLKRSTRVPQNPHHSVKKQDGVNESTQDPKLPNESTQDPKLPNESTQDPKLPNESTQDPKLPNQSSQKTQMPKESKGEPNELKEKPTEISIGFMSSRFQYILAIDLGTMYSGYAYANTHDIDLETGKIDGVSCRQVWNSGRANHLSLKTSTCILLNADKEVDSFGFEAENKYAKITMKRQQNEFYYFRCFKMALYEKTITSDLSLTEEAGKTLPARLVFGRSILALKQSFFDNMKQRGTPIDKNSIRYVLTVPAIWSDAAKQFMRKAAIDAGIKNEQLLLALEPEAASIYSQFMKLEMITDLKLTLSKVGTQYLVADLGAGTADIAVHEKLPSGYVKEITRCRGEDCGGNSINSALGRELVRILGSNVLNEIQAKNPSISMELYREFEAAKKLVGGEGNDDIEVRLPYDFYNFFNEITNKDLKQVLKSNTHDNDMTFVNGNLCIKKSMVIDKFFKPTKDKIIQLLKQVVLEVEGKDQNSKSKITKILLVGGFSDSKYIQNAVRENFQDKHVIIPESADLCVLKGAVLFGHSPHLISHRVARFTYGVRARKIFNRTEHDEKRKVIVNGNEYCENDFCPYVNIGAVVERGTAITERFFTTISNQKLIRIPVFASLSSNSKYTDEEDIEEVGQFIIDIMESTEERRSFNVSLIFGDTEIQVVAKDSLSGIEEKAHLKFILY